jgi:EAL domain-containing protein (putative c-di-GMP-specific phosphodiesterase class I)
VQAIEHASSKVMHHKVLAHLLDPQGEAIAAREFLPWIETQGELETIKELGVFGVMGRLIGPPEPK